MILFRFPDEIVRYQVKLINEECLRKSIQSALEDYSDLIKVELEKEEEHRNNPGLRWSRSRHILSKA